MQPEQNTKLYRSYIKESRGIQGTTPARHRGKSPQQPAFFTRSIRARQESALLANLCRLLGALPPSPAGQSTARSLVGLGRAELLCQAYESYRSLVGTPLISFEHAVFLLNALWCADELVMGACRDCGAVLVADRWSLRPPRCCVCGPAAPPAGLLR